MTNTSGSRCPLHGAPVVDADHWECACKRPAANWLTAFEARLAARTPGKREINLGENADIEWQLLAEVHRLREALSSTHDTYCDEPWTSRGLHAPGCLLFEIE